MVKFLINRPIAVIMSFIAICMLGVVAYFQLPVSLMPNIAIPEITVQVSYPNSSAEEMERAVVKNIRRKLLQLSDLKDINSETRSGSSVIKLQFEYGTNINYAFIETNEKIDGIMNGLPRDMERPKVIKASATDIPVFYLNVSLKEHSENKFLELSDFCESVIKRHIEQLPQIAMTDLSGQMKPRIVIVPNNKIMNSLGLDLNQIRTALQENNVELGNLLIRDGHYQYHVRFSSVLHTKKDIEEIYFNTGDRILQLKDIAEVKLTQEKQRGMFTTGEKPAITMAVIKQANARMDDMKEELNTLVAHFKTKYKELEFEVAQDQTQLLDYSISNLKSSLVIGAILVFLIMFVFLKNLKSSFLVGTSIPVSLIVALLFFMFFGLSINIISLSGLILAVGMMIDNSIIVIDNINQHYERCRNLEQACIEGTNEVIRPLLSSALTTSAIFLPLVFLSGISGALFFDQAVTVTIGLGVSFIVSISLLPTLFYLLFKKEYANRKSIPKPKAYLSKLFSFEHAYEKGFDFVFGRKTVTIIMFLLLLPLAVLLYYHLEKEKLPTLEQTELIATIDWNESIRIEENKTRLSHLFNGIDSIILQKNSLIGEQQFLLDRDNSLTMSEAKVYLKTHSDKYLTTIENHLNNYIQKHYSLAQLTTKPPQTIFEKLFSSDEVPLIARISQKNSSREVNPEEVTELAATLDSWVNNSPPNRIPLEEKLNIEINFEKLLVYDVSYNELVNQLKAAFNEYKIGDLKSSQRFIPIVLGDRERLISEILNNLNVKNKRKEEIPVKSLIKTERKIALKTITAGRDGTYTALHYWKNTDECEKTITSIKAKLKENENFDVSFAGSFFSQELMFKELLYVLAISLLLLYFILAAQFESLIQPLIVLIEVPIDIAGALFMLWLFDASLNIMAMIGIVVMSGIIINDSILKIDTINRLRNEMPLLEAIKTGGHRRIRPIIMTSLTTIFALVPFLFSSGMGAELQLPLALTVIGGMTIGTIVSLYFIPLAYWLIYKNNYEL